MSSKLQCPNCNKILREFGDLGKRAEGEYKVIGSLGVEIRCCECGHIATVSDFD